MQSELIGGRCENCEFWLRPRSVRGICQLASSQEGIANTEDSKATSVGEDRAWLVTDPDFGCVQFQQRSGL
jgi:hypothetical protein